MKGDFSKQTFDPEEHFHDVLMQQGRVFLDQDWNEQTGITGYRSETTARDIIGVSGGPLDNGGFKITSVVASPPTSPPSGDLNISAGHYYVDGILCENDADILFENQPDFPGQVLPTVSGNYQLYLDVWLLHVTATEDNGLREVALGGPDTTTRTKVIWQVKCSQIGDTSPITPLSCAGTDLPAETLVSAGTLSARSEPTQNTDDPCGIAATGGYRRLQNQLYRVEIHQGSAATGGPTYKWSRDNGSIIVSWQDYDLANPAELKVSSLGKDELSGFNSGDWIEIIDNTSDLLIKPGILARISKPPQNNIITVDTSTIIFPDSTTTAISFADKINPRIRRWDSIGDLPVNPNTWADLEDGVQIMLSADSLKTGDYWTIPARTATADVEWPKDAGNNAVAALPFGIKHHYAKLAVASFDTTNGWTVISDCRNLFPPLTELTALYYVGGDGQETSPGSALPEPLMVGVANGSWAVSGAKVQFKILQGGGSLDPADGMVTTGADGIAQCKWTLDTSTSIPGPQVSATLLDDAGNPVQVLDNNGNITQQKLPVIFSAGFGTGSGSEDCCSITVGPNGKYKTLVQAISELSKLKKENADLDVSLCLLPGDHLIEENLDMTKMSFQTLHISGVAAHISMTADRIVFVADKKIVLEGFSLDTPQDHDQINNPQIIAITTDSLTIDHCSFIRNGAAPAAPAGGPQGTPGQSSMPFVYINNSKNGATVYLSNNVFLGFFSLVLAAGVQGVIEKNTITLLLLQDGGLQDFKPNPVVWTTGDNGTKRTIRDAMAKDQQGLTPWVLAIKGNLVGGIITNFNGFIYLTIIISENIFNLPNGLVIGNSFVAQYLTMVNNQFLYIPPNAEPFVVAYIAAFSPSLSGNMSRIFGERVFCTIDVISIFNNLGINPNLNIPPINTNF